MREGWLHDSYLILFADEELESAAARYATHSMLPGFDLLGLVGWDDFLLRDAHGRVFTAPTVPCVREYLKPYELPNEVVLVPDPRRAGTIKWYLKPIVFGGDPTAGANMTWVSHEQHAELVRWWNDKYRSVAFGNVC